MLHSGKFPGTLPASLKIVWCFRLLPEYLNEDIREPAKSLYAEHGNITQLVSFPESQIKANCS